MGQGDRPLPQAKLLGVTATPIRGDGRGLGEHYQAMVQGPTAQQLTDDGYLAAPRCWHHLGSTQPACVSGWATSTPSKPSNVSARSWATALATTANTYPARRRSRSAAAWHMQRRWRICSSRLALPRPASMGAWTPAHGGSCCSDLGRRLKVLTSCALIGEGVDVPSVGGCILLRPTASVGCTCR
jgi:DNA repair protein RadD